MRHLLFILSLMLIVPVSLNAEELPTEEVIARAYHAAYLPARDKIGHVKITKRQGAGHAVQNADFFRLKDGEQFKTALVFQNPDGSRKGALLVSGRIGQEPSRWGMPAKVSLEEIGNSYLEGDVLAQSFEKTECHYLEGALWDHYWIRCQPVVPNVAFSHYDVMIRKPDFIPVKYEYVDRDGVLIRLIYVSKLGNVGGFATPLEVVDRDLKSGQEVTIEYEDVRYNSGVPAAILVKENVENGKLPDLLENYIPEDPARR